MSKIIIGFHTDLNFIENMIIGNINMNKTKKNTILNNNSIKDVNAYQVFMGNNKSSSLKQKTHLSNKIINKIKKYVIKNRIYLIIHSIYVLNLCNAKHTSGKVQYMNNNILYDLEMGSKISAKCVVLHLGYKKDLSVTMAINNLTDNINYLCSIKPKNIKIAIETSTGQGSQIGYTLEELAIIWNKLKFNNTHKINIGICIDTAHIYASGYNISTLQGITQYFELFNKCIGLNNIILIHLNDTPVICGSKIDKHCSIGTGNIFNTNNTANLLFIITFSIKNNIPIILETNGTFNINNFKPYIQQFKLLQQLS